jgi:hypothetical protein
MKKLILLFAVLTILISVRTVLPQTLIDYISEVKGDTLVIKDYSEMNNQPNALYWALTLDTVNVPIGRVYELKAGGLYPLNNTPTSSSKHPTVIVGSDPTIMVNNKNAESPPPLIYTDDSYLGWTCGIDAGGDLTIKNCELVCTANDGRTGVAFTSTRASNLHLVYDNCLLEHCAHWIVYIRSDSNESVIFRNCYFVNLNGQPCRRDGGVFISFNNQDTLLVENCTHVMTQGQMYKFEIYPDNYPPFYPHDNLFKRIIFNHNTFINCAGTVFMNPGYQNNVSVANNIFVNCNVQAYSGIHNADSLEQDPDWLPMGLINVYDSAEAPIKFKVFYNLFYCDPSLYSIADILNSNKVNGVTNWQSQMIIMNNRAQSMFDNDINYPYLYEGRWFDMWPNFTDPQDLFTTQLANLKAFAISTVDTSSMAILPDWRLVNTSSDRYIYADWPIPVDLSYNNSELLLGGFGGFPVGDLNWFPTQKVAWLKQRNNEYEQLGTWFPNPYLGIERVNTLSQEFGLQQNYPNPFNPLTVITFTLPETEYITLNVYNDLGEEVATLMRGNVSASTYKVTFDASRLSSGVYIYSLQAGKFHIAKKMIYQK